MNYNIDISNLDNILKMRYNDKMVSIIKDFLLEFVDIDINAFDEGEETLNKKTNYFINSIVENGVVVGIKIIYIPTRVLPEIDCYSSTKIYKACCRRILFGDDGEFRLESSDIIFDIFASEELNQQMQYSIEIYRKKYDHSGVMISNNYGVIKQQLKKFDFSDFILISEHPYQKVAFSKEDKKEIRGVPIASYTVAKDRLIEKKLDLENSIIEINYDELFNEGFRILENNFESFLNKRVILFVECVRVSHDVAFIKILKGIYTVPTKFESYFNLSNQYLIKLPDISFPRHLDHGEYELDYGVLPKPLEHCNLELEEAIELGLIDRIQKDFLIRLCKINSRDCLSSNYFEYGAINRFGKK